MLRGRHRGLPNAIDRAVMLPREFKKTLQLDDDDDEAPIGDNAAQNGTVDLERNADESGSSTRENKEYQADAIN